ncbi:Hypothetical protein ADU71_0079 (plasmid) [Pediococcus damnosus]|uniref:hypothetical protein n=1 Tax=Pediococcus damnosus TaxID=51663 RepID=UPI00078E5443|nr:hypothetical protein [Pediococcus damnosus]AMV66054.1 Hypothetical protein ADU71_0079 [Pediococcus damnosus]
MKKMAVAISSGKLVIETSQNSKFENLQLLLTNHVQSYYLNKEVLSVEDDAVNYRFTLDLAQTLSAMVDDQQLENVFRIFSRVFAGRLS